MKAESVVRVLCLTAAVASTAQTADAQTFAYKLNMLHGRQFVQQKKYSEAEQVFSEVLKDAPHDVPATVELGSVLFEEGKLKDAERFIRDADRPNANSSVGDTSYERAAYVLGRILEAKGQPDAAADAYRSIKVYAVSAETEAAGRERLRALGARDAVDPLMPLMAAGPFSSPDDYCTSRPEGEACAAPSRTEGPTAKSRLSPPFLEARIISTVPQSDVASSCVLAIRIASGWWIADNDLMCTSNRVSLWVKEFVVKKLGNEPRLVLRYEQQFDARWGMQESDLMIVCGVGTSTIPSCTPAIVRSWSSAIRVRFAFKRDAIVVSQVRGEPTRDAQRGETPTPGVHKITFR